MVSKSKMLLGFLVLSPIAFAVGESLTIGETVITPELALQKVQLIEELLRQIYTATIAYSLVFQVLIALATIFITAGLCWFAADRLLKHYIKQAIQVNESLSVKVTALETANKETLNILNQGLVIKQQEMDEAIAEYKGATELMQKAVYDKRHPKKVEKVKAAKPKTVEPKIVEKTEKIVEAKKVPVLDKSVVNRYAGKAD